MVTNAKSAFSERLNKILDELDFPPKGKGRQVSLAKRLDVSQKGARKWLEGEAIPTRDNILALAEVLGCSPSFIEYGVDDTMEVETASDVDTFEVQYHNGSEISSNHNERLVLSWSWASSLGITKRQLRYLRAVRVADNEMTPQLHESDIAIVRTDAKKIVNGQVYAVAHKGLMTVRRLYLRSDVLLLVSDNPAVAAGPVVIKSAHTKTASILGLVVARLGAIE